MTAIAIRGGGAAGSYLYRLLKDHKINAQLFDVTNSYFKACGEAVTNAYSPKVPWKIIDEVHDFNFILDGTQVYSTHYRYPKWVIIDKQGWINSMRETALKPDKNVSWKNFDAVIDATGPYARDRRVVCAIRAIVKTDQQAPGVTLEFNSKLTGFYWAFPSGSGKVNVGAGFMEVKNPKLLLLEYLRKKFPGKILSLMGAPISIGKVRQKQNRIGEARGLVFPVAGEGIRPAAISAEVAADAIISGDEINARLEEKLAHMENEIRAQRQLLSIYASLPPYLRRSLMKRLFKKEYIVDAYLSDEIGIWQSISNII
ncbi:MAG: NAD(P)/FAD-dependent oxidoreductase [Thermoprotei archaeon]